MKEIEIDQIKKTNNNTRNYFIIKKMFSNSKLVFDQEKIENIKEGFLNILNIEFTKEYSILIPEGEIKQLQHKFKIYTEQIERIQKLSSVQELKKEIFIDSCAKGRIHIFENLLQEGFDPSSYDNIAIQEASYHGQIEIIERLLQYPGVDPSVNDNFVFSFAATHGEIKVLKRLLLDDRVDPCFDNLQSMFEAAMNDHVESVRILFHNQKVQRLLIGDPSFKFQMACFIGELDVIENLLRDGVDPSHDAEVSQFSFIQWAVFGEQPAIIQRLLKDHRVDHSVINYAEIKNDEVLLSLLRSPKVIKSNLADESTVQNILIQSRLRMSCIFSKSFYQVPQLPVVVLCTILSYIEPYHEEEIKIFEKFIHGLYLKRQLKQKRV